VDCVVNTVFLFDTPDYARKVERNAAWNDACPSFDLSINVVLVKTFGNFCTDPAHEEFGVLFFPVSWRRNPFPPSLE
jgi:hypothetical protein